MYRAPQERTDFVVWLCAHHFHSIPLLLCHCFRQLLRACIEIHVHVCGLHHSSVPTHTIDHQSNIHCTCILWGVLIDDTATINALRNISHYDCELNVPNIRTLLVLFHALLSGGDMNVDATSSTCKSVCIGIYICTCTCR